MPLLHVRVVLALLTLATLVSVTASGPLSRAGKTASPGEPSRSDLADVLRTAPPHIQGGQLYDEAFARAAVQQAADALSEIDTDDVPHPQDRYAQAGLTPEAARRDLLDAREALSRGEFTEAVRLASQAEAAARALQFQMQMQADPEGWRRLGIAEELTRLTRRHQEQQEAARNLEAAQRSRIPDLA